MPNGGSASQPEIIMPLPGTDDSQLLGVWEKTTHCEDGTVCSLYVYEWDKSEITMETTYVTIEKKIGIPRTVTRWVRRLVWVAVAVAVVVGILSWLFPPVGAVVATVIKLVPKWVWVLIVIVIIVWIIIEIVVKITNYIFSHKRDYEPVLVCCSEFCCCFAWDAGHYSIGSKLSDPSDCTLTLEVVPGTHAFAQGEGKGQTFSTKPLDDATVDDWNQFLETLIPKGKLSLEDVYKNPCSFFTCLSDGTKKLNKDSFGKP